MSDLLTTTTRRPRFRRAAAPPSFQLTDRDIEIVRQVAEHRFLRSTHISQLLDAPHHKIRQRLTALFHAGYLDRPRSQLEYHVRGGGSAPLVYGLSNRGARLLTERNDNELVRIDLGRKNAEATRHFLLHTLAVADFRVALAMACRSTPGITLQQPTELLRSMPGETRAARQPWSWRVRVQHNGETQEVGLLPDYVFALVFADGTRRAFLVECDRGTMPVVRARLSQTSMMRKFLGYEGGRAQKHHTSRFGWKQFRVLVVTTSIERVTNMRAAIANEPAINSSPLFLFASLDALLYADILNYKWSHSRGTAHSLSEGKAKKLLCDPLHAHTLLNKTVFALTSTK